MVICKLLIDDLNTITHFVLKKIIFVLFLVNKILYKITTNILFSGKCSHKHTDLTKSNQKYILWAYTQDIAISIGDIKNIFAGKYIFTPFARYTLGITVLSLANSLDSSPRHQQQKNIENYSGQTPTLGTLATHKINYSSLFFLLDLRLVFLSRVGLSN